MTTNQAINQAREEITMYRQGHGWIVSGWNDRHQASWLSQELSYACAVQHAKELRINRALCLLGVDDMDANHTAMEAEGRYEDIVRAAVS